MTKLIDVPLQEKLSMILLHKFGIATIQRADLLPEK
jgi:hypothetical protein